MNKQFKIVLDCLEEYSDAVFEYGKTYELYERRPTIFKKNFIEKRKEALSIYKKFRKEIRNLAKAAKS
jgi:hypothetical protein